MKASLAYGEVAYELIAKGGERLDFLPTYFYSSGLGFRENAMWGRGMFSARLAPDPSIPEDERPPTINLALLLGSGDAVQILTALGMNLPLSDGSARITGFGRGKVGRFGRLVFYGGWADGEGLAGTAFISKRSGSSRHEVVLPAVPDRFTSVLPSSISFNRHGDCAFVALSDMAGVERGGLWLVKDGQLISVAEETQAAPNGAGSSFGSLWDLDRGPPALNDRGHVAFTCNYPDSGGGIWLYRDGELELVADTVSSRINIGGTLAYFHDLQDAPQPGLNNLDHVVFRGAIRGFGVGREEDTGIWIWKDGDVSAVVREGEIAPGTDGDRFITFLYRRSTETPSINARGVVAFYGEFDSANGSRGGGVFRYDSLGLTKVYLDLEPAPELSEEIYFHPSMSRSSPFINQQGMIAFFSGLFGPGYDQSRNLESLWVALPAGELLPIAIPGRDLPGNLLGTNLRGCIRVEDGNGGEQGWPTILDDDGQVFFKCYSLGTHFIVGSVISRDLSGNLAGDLDGDGQCTVLDLVSLGSHLSSQRLLPEAALDAADVNRDGFVDGFDLEALEERVVLQRP